jgi:chaperonin GroES
MSTKKIRPLNDRVVVRREEEESKSAGGIVLPGSAAEKPARGRVVAVGNGKVLENGDVRALGVRVDEVVVFGQYAGHTVKLDGEEYLILTENEIFGVIE